LFTVYGSGDISLSQFSNNDAEEGGAVYTNAIETFFTDCTFSLNTAENEGDDVYLESNALGTVPDGVFFTRCDFESAYGTIGIITLTDSNAQLLNIMDGGINAVGSSAETVDATNSEINFETSSAGTVDATNSEINFVTSSAGTINSDNCEVSFDSSTCGEMYLNGGSLWYKATVIDMLSFESGASVTADGETNAIKELYWSDGELDGVNNIVELLSVTDPANSNRMLSGSLVFIGVSSNITSNFDSSVECFNGGTVRLNGGAVTISSGCSNIPSIDLYSNGDLTLETGLTVNTVTCGENSVVFMDVTHQIILSSEGSVVTGFDLTTAGLEFTEGDQYIIVTFSGAINTDDLTYTLNPELPFIEDADYQLFHSSEVTDTEIIIHINGSVGLIFSMLLVLLVLLQ